MTSGSSILPANSRQDHKQFESFGIPPSCYCRTFFPKHCNTLDRHEVFVEDSWHLFEGVANSHDVVWTCWLLYQRFPVVLQTSSNPINSSLIAWAGNVRRRYLLAITQQNGIDMRLRGVCRWRRSRYTDIYVESPGLVGQMIDLGRTLSGTACCDGLSVVCL